jgi:hypothetical protein
VTTPWPLRRIEVSRTTFADGDDLKLLDKAFTDLVDLAEYGGLAGMPEVIAERLRQVRMDPAEGIDGRAFQAAELAAEIGRGTS